MTAKKMCLCTDTVQRDERRHIVYSHSSNFRYIVALLIGPFDFSSTTLFRAEARVGKRCPLLEFFD
jgi:hypothetical protein